MTTQTLDLSAIPNLPGYGFKAKKKNYGKTQGFATVNGVRIEQAEGLTFDKPKFVKLPYNVESRRVGSMGASTMQDDYVDYMQCKTTEAPAWDVLDRHVLRFYGQFQEAVIEANLENYRTRQCVIMYYLEDDTAQIVEKKVDNSGLPQGQVLRRHRFPGAGEDGYLDYRELQVGSELHIYGRVIQILDCDGWTRQYFAAMGMEQGASIPSEEDAFSQSQIKMGGPPHQPRTYEKVYREAQIGGGHINADMQQFMEWDRKVLRFFAVFDDLSLPQFERRPFEILYFLADDTVEIREKYPLNCGRDPFSIYFRRGKLARGKVEVLGPLDRHRKKGEYFSAEDFEVGASPEMLGQKFFIYDADPYTRQYYKEELHRELEPPVDVRLPERTVPRPKTPPYTGYGTWDDSMGSVHALMPKKPKIDFVKLYNNEGKILRFTAQLYDAKPDDMDRMFILNFHLFDDTLSIHEPPQRNLGIMTGKFLEKGVHLNQNTGKLFQIADFLPGNIVKVYNREFEILDMDEYTRKYLEEGDVKRHFDLEAVLQKLREGMRQQFPLVRDIFRKFDSDHDGVLTMVEFKNALAKWGFQVTEEEALIIMKYFDTRKDGQISYNEFCDNLMDEDSTNVMMKQRAPLDQDAGDYPGLARSKVMERNETEKVRKAAQAIGTSVYEHSATFMRLLKEFGHLTHESTVTVEQVQEALEGIGKSYALEDVQRCVNYVLPGVALDKIPYVDFLRQVVTSFHDLSGKR
eukprot:TRINITY_DN49106_c0_g1_i1.p1 TRINITY_DN49106_c0_g1~~TRINITY_DN49106_c0_g1_i1.p1  ORF type:complete len:744 (+),score=187.06 TRINITY_DN49106_c0_g1_i1:106-2337(+)